MQNAARSSPSSVEPEGWEQVPRTLQFVNETSLIGKQMQVGLLHEAQHESFIDLLSEVHGFYNNGALISRQTVRDHLLGNLLGANSPHCLVVASTADHTALGFAALTLVFSFVDFDPNRRKHCQLKELYVRSPYRSAGVGRALMSWVAQFALDNGCHRIDWPVKAANARGISFYEELGAALVPDRLSYRLVEPALSGLARGA
jgi:GNAT superfamily N-acetyltransferase